MTVGEKAFVLVVAGTMIPLAVPLIYFPTTTATAVSLGLLVAATIVSRSVLLDAKPLLLRDQFPPLARIPVSGDNRSYRLPALDRGMLAGLATTVVVVLLAYVSGTFHQVTFLDRGEAHPERNFVLTAFNTACNILAAHFFLLPKLEAFIRARLTRSLDKRLRKLRPAVDTAASQLSKLRANQNDIDIFCRDLGLRPRQDFFTETASTIASLPLTASGLTTATTATNTALSKARAERDNLERATACYSDATARAAKLRRLIDKIRDRTLSEEFDDLSRALSSAELKDLAGQRKWRDFFEVISLLITDIDRLQRKVQRFANQQRKDGAVDDSDTVSIDWAYRVLKVSPTATSTEIKKAFRSLCLMWHPDAGKVRDDAKIKDITRAYHVLKKAKHFA